MNTESDLDLSPKEARKIVYQNSVLMLEKLNILIAILENPEAVPAADFLEEVIEKSFELGGQVAAMGAGMSDDDKAEQFGIMAGFFGGP